MTIVSEYGPTFSWSGFSYTPQGQIQDFLLGGVPTLIGGGANLRHRCFLVETHVKTKEFGPVGGGARQKLLYVDPPLPLKICGLIGENKNPDQVNFSPCPPAMVIISDSRLPIQNTWS